MKIGEALDIVGGLSAPSKMPGFGYSIPAARCQIGAKLREVKGSVCSGCYALKGRYVFPTVENALEKRYQSLSDPRWVDSMVLLINEKAAKVSPYFRWHDAGDLQSLEHLSQIVEVCKRTPKVSHWLPTREYKLVQNWLEQNPTGFPSNLVVRLSAHMVGTKAPAMGLATSTVDSGEGRKCPAPTQGNSCGDCRACWSSKVANVDYHKH